jgi:hypothetical protein
MPFGFDAVSDERLLAPAENFCRVCGKPIAESFHSEYGPRWCQPCFKAHQQSDPLSLAQPFLGENLLITYMEASLYFPVEGPERAIVIQDQGGYAFVPGSFMRPDGIELRFTLPFPEEELCWHYKKDAMRCAKETHPLKAAFENQPHLCSFLIYLGPQVKCYTWRAVVGTPSLIPIGLYENGTDAPRDLLTLYHEACIAIIKKTNLNEKLLQYVTLKALSK